MNKKKIIFAVIVALLLTAFGVSAFMVGSYLLDGKKQAERNEELAQMVEAAKSTTAATQPQETAAATDPSTPETTAPTGPTEPKILEPYAGLYALNSDMAGWLEIPNTELKYPVMHKPDEPNYYLYRDFDKGDSVRGAVYAWEAADINKPSDNITMFGHNMKDGSMFATLNNYVNEYFWEDNQLILFDTLYEYHTYKIFAVFKTSASLGEGFAYHKFVNAANEQEFNDFVSTCKKLSFYDTGITPVYGDKLICLSTCEYTLENGRLVVAAVRIT